MSQTRSSSTQQVYGLARVCRAWEVARSTVYAAQGRAAAPAGPPRRRGPMLRDMRKRGNLDRLLFSSRAPAATACAWPRRRVACSYPRQS
jgi:hypothetical protein